MPLSGTVNLQPLEASASLADFKAQVLDLPETRLILPMGASTGNTINEVRDVSGNDRHLTISGARFDATDGGMGFAVMDGVNDYLYTVTGAWNQITGPKTFFGLARLTTIPLAEVALVSKAGNAVANRSYAVLIDIAQKLLFNLYTSGGTKQISPSVVIPTGTWFAWAIRHNPFAIGSPSMNAYVRLSGASAAVGANSATGVPAATQESTVPLTLGATSNSASDAPTQFLTGDIGPTHLCSSAFSETLIQSLLVSLLELANAT